jgi:alpha-galactosidase
MAHYERLDGGALSLVLAIGALGAPRLLHFGERLSADADLASLDAATAPFKRGSTPDEPVEPSILPVAGAGYAGTAAVAGATSSLPGPIAWTVASADRRDDGIDIVLADPRMRLRARLAWRVDPETGVLTTQSTLRNDGGEAFHLDALAALTLPAPAWARDIVAFAGAWADEARPHRFQPPPGAWVQTNRTGRTGFAGATFLLAEPRTDDLNGRAIAVHLAWSGDHTLAVETLEDGRRVALAFPGLASGEIVIAPGEEFSTPFAHVAFSATGFNGLSDAFHPFVRRSILPRTEGPRRVHVNTWEAAYFDFDVVALKSLADRAAALGAERFVLDDGWFTGRRNDRAGLGDWAVDPKVFPDGLDPLITHVRELGMDFGLWVEPEMVNPDSDLYRRHPDWCVHAPDTHRMTMRNQLWLDLTRTEVRDRLFEQLDALLRAHTIAYLKWDCNRMLFPAVGRSGPFGHALTQGFYALLDRVRAAHPDVEIESCASGGARIDLEVLRRTVRVWPSDTTDALERLRIQRWTGMLLPPETLGAHVGPSPNPITGRRLSMLLRARVAMFGHMGLELNPARLSDDDQACLAAHVALYKRWRTLLHGGRMSFWSSDDGADCRMSLAPNGAEALALLVRAQAAAPPTSAPVRFPGLDPAARYAVTLPEPWPKLAGRRLKDGETWRGERVFDGAVLVQAGLRLPLADPETAWLAHFRRL